MRWTTSHRADKLAIPIADRHYNRQKVGSPQFAPPGACLVFLAPNRTNPQALWITSWPKAEYVRHAWAGAWVNSCFRNEGAGLSSELIIEAVAATKSVWTPPKLGIVSFIDTSKIRKKRDPGRCYIKAGWIRLKERTKGGLVVVQQKPEDMPTVEKPHFGIASRYFQEQGRLF